MLFLKDKRRAKTAVAIIATVYKDYTTNYSEGPRRKNKEQPDFIEKRGC